MAAAESDSKNSDTQDFLKQLKNGLGKDKPIKCWLDSDCTAFDAKCHSMTGHPCDVDDAWALMAILNSDRCELVGVSSTFGNDGEKWTYKDLQKCLSLHPKGKNIKVYSGAKKPIPNMDGPFRYKNPTKFVTVTNDGVEALRETLEALGDDEKLYIYADGPATNMALLLLFHPHVIDKIACIVMFMSRNTVDNPILQIGTKMQQAGAYFTDFNHDLDPFAAQVVLMSGVRCVLVGCETAFRSMWLFEDDLKGLQTYSTSDENKGKTLLLEYLSKPENYEHWLDAWKTFGDHLPPWEKYGAIDGFVPFGVVSASVLFASEYLKVDKVDASFAIAKSFKKYVGPITNHKSTVKEISDTGAQAILTHFKHAPTALHAVHTDHTTDAKDSGNGGDSNSNAATTGSGDSASATDEKKADDSTSGDKQHWYSKVGGKIEDEAESLKKQVFQDTTEHDDSDSNPCYYEYFLCTNENPKGTGSASKLVSFVNKHTNGNVYYVPSLAGKFPWKEYKDVIMDIFKKTE